MVTVCSLQVISQSNMKQTLLFIVFIYYFSQGVLGQIVCRDGQLRRDSDNRLWACGAGQWGTVCAWNFDMYDAIVACRNLGYADTESGITYSTIDGAEGFTALGSLKCDGSENYLYECLSDFDYLNYCDHSMDVTLTCPSLPCADWDLRLVDGFSSNEGTLEICKDGSWNTICSSWFGAQEAYVACRELGFGSSTAQVTETSYGTGHGWAKYTQFSCFGNETTLSQCGYMSSDSCQSYDPYTGYVSIAQIKCSGDSAQDSCTSAIRINNNGEIQKKGSGRLELCNNGAWGTVSNSNFSVKDSVVACAHLGVPNPSTQLYPQGYYTNNVAGPIIMTNLMCTGAEVSLYMTGPVSCNPDQETTQLNHSTDVFLNCWTKVFGVSCNNGDVRLVNGSNIHEGRVEVCKSNEWGTYCDNWWDRREASVICRQLGYPNPYGAFYLDSKFGTGDQIPYFFTDVNCAGTENGISSCEKNDQIEGSKCLYGQAVGVKCYNNTGCTDGEVRLIGGNDYEGDVQICRDGVWGYICDQEWEELSAQVVCRQMGYSDQWYGRSTSSVFGGSQDIAPIVYDGIACLGGESSLNDCTDKKEYSSLYPTCRYVAGVTCLKTDGCNAGDVRLQGGAVSSEGRLEVCSSGSWTTVKSSEIMYSDAQAVCKQLGYDSEWSVATEGNTWGTGNRMIYFDTVDCDGTEQSFTVCPKTPILISTDAASWYYYERAGVSCETRSLAESCSSEGAIRLKDGATAREGRLEICLNNYWGSVCNRDWTQDNGLVACRQAGFETLRPLLTSSPTRMNGSVSVYNVKCIGHESKVSDCDWSDAISVSSCYHGEDVALICSELPEPYSVITISSNVEEPLPLGSEVTFSCDGAPGTGDIFYSWSRDNIDLGLNTSSITFKVGVNFTKTFNVYCNVYRINEKVAVGRREFTVEDLITATESLIITTLGSMATLSFNRGTTHVNGYLRELTWSLNDNVLDTSPPRFTVSDDGLTLSIDPVTDTDLGLYSVQYNGLDIQTHNEFCEGITMSFMRDYPILSPGYIILTIDEFSVEADIVNSDNYNHQLLQTYDRLNYTLGDYLVDVTALRLAAIPSESILQPEWYFNGAQYIDTTELTLRDYYPLHFLYVWYPTLFDSGFYQLVLKYPFESVMVYSGCSSLHGSRYLEFLQSKEFLGFENNYFILDTATIEVRYTEMPTAQLTSDRGSFSISEDAVISCIGRLGYPRYYEVSLWKNGINLKSTTGFLEFNTSNITEGSKYGEYWCTVNNTILEDTTSLKISNEAMISVLLANVDCSNFEYTVSDVEPSMLARFEDTCNCTLSDAVLKESTLSCSLVTGIATFNTTLVYTNYDGSLVANTIVNWTLTEFNDRINRTLTVNGVALRINIGPPDEEDSFELSEEAKIGIAFAGGFLLGSLIFIFVIIILVVKMKRHKNIDKAGGNERVNFRNEGVKIDDIDDNDFQPPPTGDDDD